VAEGKPAPDGYLAAAARLGHPPRGCVVFEDAPSGVGAARAAGVGAVVGIGPRSSGLDVDRSVDDLRHVRWTHSSLHVD
jgi:mannitol-1-/sugar-/sorbitol-6-phosphatase